MNKQGNIPHQDVAPHFSNLEVISLRLAAEALGINRKNFLFSN